MTDREAELEVEVEWLRHQVAELEGALDRATEGARLHARALHEGVASGKVIPLPVIDMHRMRVVGGIHAEETWR